MWKLGWEINFRSDVFEKIYLKLPRNCCFKMVNTYYVYNWDDEGIYVDVATYVDEKDKEKAYREAFKNIRESNYILSYLYSIDFGSNPQEFFKYKFQEVSTVEYSITNCSNLNFSRIQNINEKINLMDNKTYKYFIKCVQFISKAQDYHYNLSLNEEALLSVFKSVELIASAYSKGNVESVFEKNIKRHFDLILKETFSEEYNKDFHSAAYKSVKNTLFTLMSLKRKIKFCVKGLGMGGYTSSDEVDSVIDFRNSILAHSNLAELDEEVLVRFLSKTFNISREMISRFFFNIEYNDIDLNVNYTTY